MSETLYYLKSKTIKKYFFLRINKKDTYGILCLLLQISNMS